MTATHERQGRARDGAIARDEVVRLGPEGQLVGIVSHPDGGSARRGAGDSARRDSLGAPVAAVLLNAGVLHRVGPHRVHVAIGRDLAARGIPALRLDLGMIGDSTASSDAPTFRESAVADTRAAMAGLGAALGARRFVLFGICSGADNALATALVDDRVAGVVLVDPAAYASRAAQLRELRARVARLGARAVARWGAARAARRARAALEAAAHRLRHRGAAPVAPAPEGRVPPPRAVFGEQLAALAARGVGILAVYTGIHGPRYNAPEQLFEVFPALRGAVDCAYFPRANHTFTELAQQAQLVGVAVDWIARRLG